MNESIFEYYNMNRSMNHFIKQKLGLHFRPKKTVTHRQEKDNYQQYQPEIITG